MMMVMVLDDFRMHGLRALLVMCHPMRRSVIRGAPQGVEGSETERRCAGILERPVVGAVMIGAGKDLYKRHRSDAGASAGSQEYDDTSVSMRVLVANASDDLGWTMELKS